MMNTSYCCCQQHRCSSWQSSLLVMCTGNNWVCCMPALLSWLLALLLPRSPTPSQVDKLIPSLTCRETLNFSEKCAGVSRNLKRALQQMMAWEQAHPDLATRVDLDDEVCVLISNKVLNLVSGRDSLP